VENITIIAFLFKYSTGMSESIRPYQICPAMTPIFGAEFMGVAAHGIGTSRAFAVHPEAQARMPLAMGMHGILERS
jgi:hypothetical protein